MLRKNVYILYPAGYMGTYLNWSIWKSDCDEFSNTVDNPVNSVTSNSLGGIGTAHNHTKIPTHNPPWMHFAWVSYNRPTKPNVYNINMSSTLNTFDIYQFIKMIVASDPDPVFINIHANTPDDYKFGSINSILKWPTQYKIQQLDDYFRSLHNFDPFNCKDDKKLRAMTATNMESFVKKNDPIDKWDLRKSLQIYKRWYNVRNSLQPQEINSGTYLTPKAYTEADVSDKMVFDINCADIPSNKFPTILKGILDGSGASDNYDTTYVEKFHHNYIESQKTLEWFPSIAEWRNTGKLNDFLKSHAFIEGLVLNEMFKTKPSFKNSIKWVNEDINVINAKYQKWTK